MMTAMFFGAVKDAAKPSEDTERSEVLHRPSALLPHHRRPPALPLRRLIASVDAAGAREHRP